jgi:hypothetical protein
MPGIHSLYQQLGEKEVRFLMVAVDDEFEKAIALRDKKGYTFPLYRLGQLPVALQSRSIPATYVIDGKGKLRFRHEGMASYWLQGYAAAVATAKRKSRQFIGLPAGHSVRPPAF